MTQSEINGNPDFDPAAPGPSTETPSEADVSATNLGADGHGDLPPDQIPPPLQLGHPATVAVDIDKALAFLDACMTSQPRVHYKLGAKIKPGQTPGRDFTAVDCSGFVREMIRRSTNLDGWFPDGSVVQHDWVTGKGFAPAQRPTNESVSMAFLSPNDGGGIGHVVLVFHGQTLESHGGVGPDSRPWDGTGWQSKASVFLFGEPSRLVDGGLA